MIVNNLSNPGVAPVDGDLIEAVYPNGAVEQKQYWTPVDPSPAPAPRILTKLQFLRLFNQAERMGIRAAAKVNPRVEDFMAMLDMADEINKDDQDVIDGLAAMTMGGLLAAGRAAVILA